MLPKRKPFKYNEKSKIIVEHGNQREDLTWQTSAGRILSLPEMDTNHLKNAIAKIKRGDHQNREHMLETLITEKIYREVYSLSKIKKKNEGPKRRELS